MKTNGIFLSSLLAGAAAVGLRAAPAPTPTPPDTRADVVFFEPKKFTDVKDNSMSDDPERTGYLDQFRDYIVDEAKNRIPPGYHLSVTFTDIDMAGDFEPWRGPRFDDVRIVKDIYPPRLAFAFRLTDPEGNVVKQGTRDLRDMSFQMRITMTSNQDPLRYEKSMLDDWMRAEFPRAKKG